MIKLHIITTCTNRKLVKPDKELCLSKYKNQLWSDALEDWLISIFNANEALKISTNKLYCGNHWKLSKKCETIGIQKGFETNLWVLSAGWGFIPSNLKICSYESTFASSSRDSIMNLNWAENLTNKEKCAKWWDGINQGRQLEGTCLLGDLSADSSEKSIYLFILSKDYYYAVEQELLQLISNGENIVIISAGLYSENTVTSPLIRDYILPFNDKFKNYDNDLKVANVSLNAALACWILDNYSEEIKRGYNEIYKTISDIEKSLPNIKRKDVIKMTDDEVIEFIIEHYSDNEFNSATKLLRLLRDEKGKSCEQKRFGRLFKKYCDNKDMQGRLF